jgi:hypothetical protein
MFFQPTILLVVALLAIARIRAQQPFSSSLRITRTLRLSALNYPNRIYSAIGWLQQNPDKKSRKYCYNGNGRIAVAGFAGDLLADGIMIFNSKYC